MLPAMSVILLTTLIGVGQGLFLAMFSAQSYALVGLLPRTDEGSAGYLFGPEKTRKSLGLADLALSVTTGTPAFGRFRVHHVGAAVGFFAEVA